MPSHHKKEAVVQALKEIASYQSVGKTRKRKQPASDSDLGRSPPTPPPSTSSTPGSSKRERTTLTDLFKETKRLTAHISKLNKYLRVNAPADGRLAVEAKLSEAKRKLVMVKAINDRLRNQVNGMTRDRLDAAKREWEGARLKVVESRQQAVAERELESSWQTRRGPGKFTSAIR